MAYELPQLSYNYDALEPFVDTQTMTIHHSKHHQGYVTKINAYVSEVYGMSFAPVCISYKKHKFLFSL